MKFIALFVLALASLLPGHARAAEPSRTEWFELDRLGMFIHWSASAALEGRYCGEPVRQGWYGEWLRARNRVPRADWDAGIARMSITPERVDAWAEAARVAGMKYLIFVAKHHDGLAYWPSKVSHYQFNKLSGNSFDVIARLKQACDARGIKLCFYYSQWQDWEHPGGWGNFWEFNSKDPKQFEGRDDLYFWDGSMFRDNLTPEEFDAYWRGKSMAQVEELLRSYQPALMWFDCYIPAEKTIMSPQQLGDMVGLIRKLSPDCLINSRLPSAKIGGDDGADYETLGDNEFPDRKIGHPWESAATFPLSWGYNRDDQNWRPTTYFVRNFVRNISRGGNLVINIGPLADGSISEEALVRLREFGRCIRGNREGFYGCGHTPFDEASQDWGLTTTQALPDGTTRLFLHVFDWPVDGVVRVNGLKTKARAALLTATGEKLPIEQVGTALHVRVPGPRPVPYDTVIRVDLDGVLEVDNGLIGERNGGEIVMQADRAQLTGARSEAPPKRATKLPAQIGGWSGPEARSAWRIFVPRAGSWRVKICYASALETAGGEFVLSAGPGLDLRGKVVGTHLNWTEFRSFELGELHFPEAGEYTLDVRPAGPVPEELCKLLWVCLVPPQ